jgi:hypothetical protein
VEICQDNYRGVLIRCRFNAICALGSAKVIVSPDNHILLCCRSCGRDLAQVNRVAGVELTRVIPCLIDDGQLRDYGTQIVLAPEQRWNEIGRPPR